MKTYLQRITGWVYKQWRRFIAWNRWDLNVVCEESEGLPKNGDYHDYPDDVNGFPDHFADLKCKRCGKTFTI